MRKHLLGLAVVVLTGLLSSCNMKPYDDAKPPVTVEGYRPIYLSHADLKNVFAAPAHTLKNAGKIYVQGHFVFVNEVNKGIHIINNQNPLFPQNIAFLNIPGNVDLAVKGTVLYADNGPDLLALDISNPTNATLLKRIANVFPNQMYPPQTGVSFECVDNAKGVVVGWEKVSLLNPKCRR
ncbi:MAG: hypothetical protein V4714_11560 [Bacteroidota bacterium]